jgi:hypothetical protein
MTILKKEPAHGFAAVESLLVLIIIGMVVGVGYWVITQRNTTPTSSNATNNSSAITRPVKDSTGTISSIDQLTSVDSQSEANISNANDSSEQSTAQSSSSSAANVGGAYNESNY